MAKEYKRNKHRLDETSNFGKAVGNYPMRSPVTKAVYQCRTATIPRAPSPPDTAKKQPDKTAMMR